MQRLELFATPVLIVPDALPLEAAAEARARLLALSASEPGVRRSNVGGWHSAPDLLQRPAFAALGERLADQARAALEALASRAGAPPPPRPSLRIQAWGLVLGDGDHAMPHDHADAHLSVVVHLDDVVGDEGQLVLLDDRRARLPWEPLDPSAFQVTPRAGQAVWFPAGLRHYVTPVRSGPRVSLAANVRFAL